MLCIPFTMFRLGSFPFVDSWLLIKHAVHPVIELPSILIGMMPLCLGGILSVYLTIPIVIFCSQFWVMWGICHPEYSNSFPCPKHMTVRISFEHQCQKLSQYLIICHKWWNYVWIGIHLFWGEVLSFPMLSLAIHPLCSM